MSALRSLALPSSSEVDDNQRLRSYLLRCSGADVVAACKAVETELQQHQYQTGEHVRDFYRLVVPILLKKILGFEDSQLASPRGSGRVSTTAASPNPSPNASAGGWLAEASLPGKEAQARALISLLSPRGPLFSSLLTADKESFVRYVFPTERLPEWVRHLLAAEKGVFLLCQISPLFKNRIMEDSLGAVQVHLDVFEYYMFWFAYYAVCKETNVARDGVRGARSAPASRSSQLRTQIEHWASSIPRLHQEKVQASPGNRVNPYLHLLQLYLSHFVAFPSATTSGRGLALGRGAQQDVSSSSSWSQGDILVHILIEFWLIDDDPAPLPQKARHAIGGSNGALVLKSSSPLVYVPPGNDLTDALKVLVNYVNDRSHSSGAEHGNVYSTPGSDSVYRTRSLLGPSESVLLSQSPLSPYSPSSTFSSKLSPYISRLQRPLYRFLLRSFQLWPLGSPVRRIMQVVEVWLDYLQPWYATSQHQVVAPVFTSGRNKPLTQQLISGSLSNSVGHDRFAQNSENAGSGYTEDEKWKTYVISNYLFYTQLVTHFLEFAIKNVHLDPEAILQMTYKVLAVLAQSNELLELLRKLDAAFLSMSCGKPLLVSSSLNDFVPVIQDQLENWEDGVTANIIDQENGDVNSPSAVVKSSRLRFFSLNENGGHQLLQALIVRSEVELQAATVERSPPIVQGLEAVKEIARKIFYFHAMGSNFGMLHPGFSPLPMTPLSVERVTQPIQASGLNRHSWMDVKYRGDWMRRPIEAYEIAWLARLLVKWSDTLNVALGLDGRQPAAAVYTPSAPPEPSADEVDLGEGDPEVRFKELLGIVRRRLWGLWLISQRELQRRHWRVNLRFMAERQVVVLVILVYGLYRILYTLVRLIFLASRG